MKKAGIKDAIQKYYDSIGIDSELPRSMSDIDHTGRCLVLSM